MQAKLQKAQETMNAVEDWRSDLSQAIEAANKAHMMQICRREIPSKLLSRVPGKTTMESLKAQRTPCHPTGLTLTPSRASA